MANITKKFVFFKTLANFNQARTNGELRPGAIVFVYDETGTDLVSFIYAQGKYFYTSFDPTNIEETDLSFLEDYVKWEDVEDSYDPTGTNKNHPVDSEAVKDAIDAIGSGTNQGTAGQAIVTVNQTNGVVTATPGNIAAGHVTYEKQVISEPGASPVIYNTDETDVQGAITEIYSTVRDFTTSGGVIGVYNSNGQQVSSIGVDGTTYTFKQGTSSIVTINIPKEMFLRSGEVVYGVYNPSTGVFTPDNPDASHPNGTPNADHSNAVIKLLVDVKDDTTEGNDPEEKAIYIPAKDLITLYTHSNAAGAKVTVTVNNTNHTISADIAQGSIAETDLTSAVQTKLNTTSAVAKDSNASHLTLTPSTSGNTTTYTIGESDIASASVMGTPPTGKTVVGHAEDLAAAAKTEVKEPTGGNRFIKITDSTGANGQTIYTITDTDFGDIPAGKTIAQYIQDTTGGANLWKAGTGTGAAILKNSTSTAGGNYAIAGGTGSSATGVNSFATGTSSSSTGTNSIAVGDHVGSGSQNGSAAFGTYNYLYTGADDASNTIFSIGNGTSAAPGNALDIRKDGSFWFNYGGSYEKLQEVLSDEIDWWVEPDPQP